MLTVCDTIIVVFFLILHLYGRRDSFCPLSRFVRALRVSEKITHLGGKPVHFEYSQKTQKPSDLKVREWFTFFSPQLTSLLTKTVFYYSRASRLSNW